MKLLDLYYRAFKRFRNHTLEDSTSSKLRKLIVQSNHSLESFEAKTYECIIEEDWLDNIEEGLIYIEKAIREDRQFIRTEGEVVPIEKVKKVSKASVEHLSRHSDLITRAPKDKGNIIPEKLYVVEKLSDYLVYENRFLYLLLCYLKDFIQIRLDKIRDKTTTYQSSLTMNKQVKANQRHIDYKLDYAEVYRNAPFLTDRYKAIPYINRVETIYEMTVSFLNMPLMKEVSKAPMIKPPVVKTNVLRMNPNFRAALALYDYVTSYTKDGYVINEVIKNYKPLPFEFSDELSETIMLTSSLSFMRGNDIKRYLEERYEEKEKLEQQAVEKKILDEIKRLKKRIVEMNEDPSEYILKLEKRNNQLEKTSVELIKQQDINQKLSLEVENLHQEKAVFESEIVRLNQDIHSKIDEIDTLNQKYYDDMLSSERIHEEELNTQKEAHRNYIIELMNTFNAEKIQIKEKHQEEIHEIRSEHQMEKEKLLNIYRDEISNLKVNHEQEIQSINNQHASVVNQFELLKQAFIDEIESTQAQVDLLKNQMIEMTNMYQKELQDQAKTIEELNEQIKYQNARYLGLKAQQGLLSDCDSFTTKEKFLQLELEMQAYKKLFKEEWKKTKAQIRSEVKRKTNIKNDKSLEEVESTEDENHLD